MSQPNNSDNKKKNDKQGTLWPVDIYDDDDNDDDDDDHKQHKNGTTKKFKSENSISKKEKEKNISEEEKLRRRKDDDTTSKINNDDIKMRRRRKKSKSPTKHLPYGHYEEGKRLEEGCGLVSTAAVPSMNDNNNNDTTPEIKKDSAKIRRNRKKSKSPTKHLPNEEGRRVEEGGGLVSTTTTSPGAVPPVYDNNINTRPRRSRKKSKSPTNHLPNEEGRRVEEGGGLVSTTTTSPGAVPSVNDNNINTRLRRSRKKSKSPTNHLPYEEGKRGRSRKKSKSPTKHLPDEDGLVSTAAISPTGDVPSTNDNNNNNNANDNGFVSKKVGRSREDRRMRKTKRAIDTTTPSTDDGNTNNTRMTFRMSRMADAGNTSDSDEEAEDDDSDDNIDDQPGAIPVRGVGRGVGASEGTILWANESQIQEGEDGSERYYDGDEINNNDDHLVVAELAELPEIVEGTPMEEENKRTRYIRRCILFLLPVVGVVTLILGLVLPNTGSRKNDENNTTASPTAVPTGGTSSPPSTLHTQQTIELAIQATLSNFIPDIPNGPIQERALDWLVDVENNQGDSLINITAGTLLDRYVLAIFFFSTNGNSKWEINDGWLSETSVCLWFVDDDRGAICDDPNNGRVQRINLSHNDVAGKIPTELGTLTTLIQLGLGENKLTGMIHTELGRLTALTELLIDRNDLEGTIPTELGHLTELAHVEMDKNELVGTIATELGNLSALTFLDLHSNELSGTIPTELGRLTALTHLDLESNMLTGSVPAELHSFLSSLDDCNLGCDGGLVGVPVNCQKKC